jgi:hypothetical protein
LIQGGVEVSTAKQQTAPITMRTQATKGDQVIDPADRTRQILRGALDTEPGLPHPTRLRILAGVLLLKELGNAPSDRLKDTFRDAKRKRLRHMR